MNFEPFGSSGSYFQKDWNGALAPGGFKAGTRRALSPEFVDSSDPELGLQVVYVSGGTMDISASLTTSGDLSVTLSTSPNGLEGIILFGASGVVEAKIGSSRKDLRTHIDIQALTNGMYWGYTPLCPFRIYKNQFFSIPAKDYFVVYIKSTLPSGEMALAER